MRKTALLLSMFLLQACFYPTSSEEEDVTELPELIPEFPVVMTTSEASAEIPPIEKGIRLTVSKDVPPIRFSVTEFELIRQAVIEAWEEKKLPNLDLLLSGECYSGIEITVLSDFTESRGLLGSFSFSPLTGEKEIKYDDVPFIERNLFLFIHEFVHYAAYCALNEPDGAHVREDFWAKSIDRQENIQYMAAVKTKNYLEKRGFVSMNNLSFEEKLEVPLGYTAYYVD